jgi:hypothetical protein
VWDGVPTEPAEEGDGAGAEVVDGPLTVGAGDRDEPEVVVPVVGRCVALVPGDVLDDGGCVAPELGVVLDVVVGVGAGVARVRVGAGRTCCWSTGAVPTGTGRTMM